MLLCTWGVFSICNSCTLDWIKKQTQNLFRRSIWVHSENCWAPWMFASFPPLDSNLSDVLKYIQSILLPVKCCRLKLIVRANHLYSPLTRHWKKCDPVTLAAIVFLCRGKENILVCRALFPCKSKLFWTVFIHNTNSCLMMGLPF